jgi:hypothetical protein
MLRDHNRQLHERFELAQQESDAKVRPCHSIRRYRRIFTNGVNSILPCRISVLAVIPLSDANGFRRCKADAAQTQVACTAWRTCTRVASHFAVATTAHTRARGVQLERACELGDEAMIAMRIAEAARDDAEAQLQAAAQEKVAALVHLSELSSLLHAHKASYCTRVRILCHGMIATMFAGFVLLFCNISFCVVGCVLCCVCN